jgi:hypothetical protein
VKAHVKPAHKSVPAAKKSAPAAKSKGQAKPAAKKPVAKVSKKK